MKDIGIAGPAFEAVETVALNTKSEDEMIELIGNKNPFINRAIAKNINITEVVMDTLLLDENSAYTMNINLAKNKNITTRIVDRLYQIAATQYKDSMLKEDLDSIFKIGE